MKEPLLNGNNSDDSNASDENNLNNLEGNIEPNDEDNILGTLEI